MQNSEKSKRAVEFLFYTATALTLASTTTGLAQSASPASGSDSPKETVTVSGNWPDAPVPQPLVLQLQNSIPALPNVPLATAPARILLPAPSAEDGAKSAQEATNPHRKFAETCALDVIGRSWHFGVPPSIAPKVNDNNLGGFIKCGGTIQYFAGGYPGSNEGAPIVGAGVEYDRRFKLNSSTLVYGGIMAELLVGYPRNPNPHKAQEAFYDPLSPLGVTLAFGAEKKLPPSWGRQVANVFGQDVADHFSHCYAGPRIMYVPSEPHGVSVLNLGGQVECNVLSKPKKDAQLASESKPHRSHFPHWLTKLFGKHDHQ